jgi:superfamily II DNA or RNA helicase
MPDRPQVGSLVRCRGREWIVLPSDDPDVLCLRGLGSDSETCGVFWPLAHLETIEPASFPPPNPATASDYASGQLLRNAARLSFRSGAGPFRSLGRISVRPRPYQFIPLLMGLRLKVVRLLISDDVGIGKTIEGALLARELLDRGECTRFAVVCPPHLCDQWQKELLDKFQIDATVIRSGTIAQLERRLPQGQNVYEHHPFFVASIDFVKTDRHWPLFVHACPDLVIVDEAHTCAKPPGQNVGQQQRHALMTKLAEKAGRHIIMLTATPHSGHDEQFQSILGLIAPEFGRMSVAEVGDAERAKLARHFIQRRRADVKRWLGTDTSFPERISSEEPYVLSEPYRKLFNDVYDFARELVKSADTLASNRRRVRYWAALALLRCVMSSPAAAKAALETRIENLPESELTDETAPETLFDRTDTEVVEDSAPGHVIGQDEGSLPDIERRRLRSFAARAVALAGDLDSKLKALQKVLERLLGAGFRPVVYCRYIPTSDYVGAQLRALSGAAWRNVAVASVTSNDPEDRRSQLIDELVKSPKHVLVATDCLSEGINLQEHFDAVIHYDLPWNPNRLEQREGRVDRFGQKRAEVEAILMYGRDNPMDGAVLEVLLRKARKIHRTLGISVPIPGNSEGVMETIIKSLFARGRDATQLTLFDASPELKTLHEEWDRDADREKASRTRFAQHSINPEEVAREIEECDQVLGDETTVSTFVRDGLARLGAPMREVSGTYVLNLEPLKAPHRQLYERLRDYHDEQFVFTLPAPEDATCIGRNHPVTVALAEYLLDHALDQSDPKPPAPRCGSIRTRSVTERTTILLLRARHKLTERGKPIQLAEELVTIGLVGTDGHRRWLTSDDVKRLLDSAAPDVNISPEERLRAVDEALASLPVLQPDIDRIVRERSDKLAESHARVRAITGGGKPAVEPVLPIDVLGVYVLVPIPRGATR